MRKNYQLLAICLILFQYLFSIGESSNLMEVELFYNVNEPLSGNYNISSGGDYLTLNDAVTDLNTHGVSGPMIFQLFSGIYNEQVVAGSINGANEINTITARVTSNSGSDGIVFYTATGTIKVLGNKVLHLNRHTLNHAACIATPVAPRLIANNFLISRQGNAGAPFYAVNI